jgi:hypothetical protein
VYAAVAGGACQIPYMTNQSGFDRFQIAHFGDVYHILARANLPFSDVLAVVR